MRHAIVFVFTFTLSFIGVLALLLLTAPAPSPPDCYPYDRPIEAAPVCAVGHPVFPDPQHYRCPCSP